MFQKKNNLSYLFILLIGVQFLFEGCMFKKIDPGENSSQLENGLLVNSLKCKSRINPLGIDATSPKLSWILNSKQRNQMQTAYHVLVASNEKILNQNIGDVWDSGVVDSKQIIHVTYKGGSL